MTDVKGTINGAEYKKLIVQIITNSSKKLDSDRIESVVTQEI